MRSKVRNPFEAALAERLHLPLIASPSLFQRPVTPQFSSTKQFEWTIDEVSSIKPAHFEPHETQFHESPIDPEYEAKAQMAISSYFKEHQKIVPSPPVNCSTIMQQQQQQQRKILAEINGNTPIGGKPGRRIRDFGTQTALSLPVDLPPELEEALRPYLKPHLANEDAKPFHQGSFVDNSERSSSSNSSLQSCGGGGGSPNVSMRRKLFDIHNIILWDDEGNRRSPNSPKTSSQLNQQVQHNPLPSRPSIVGKLSPDSSLDKGSRFLMSPILLGSESSLFGASKSPKNLQATVSSDGGSWIDSASKLKTQENVVSGRDADADVKQRRRCLLFNLSDDEELSPIFPTHQNKAKAVRQTEDVSDIGANGDTEMADMMAVDDGDGDGDDAVQVSNLSMQNSSNLSSGSINFHCDTPPTGTRRSAAASRKNLSQSFSTMRTTIRDDYENGDNDNREEEEGNDVGGVERATPSPFAEKKILQLPNEKNLVDEEVKISIKNILKDPPFPEITDFITETAPEQVQQQSVNFYRTDCGSGFNEMTGSFQTNSNGASMLSQQDELSRETLLNLKTNENIAVGGYDNDGVGENHHKSPLCSTTPSKPRPSSCF